MNLRGQVQRRWSELSKRERKIDVIFGSWGYTGRGMIPLVTGAKENGVLLTPTDPESDMVPQVFDVFKFWPWNCGDFDVQAVDQFREEYPDGP